MTSLSLKGLLKATDSESQRDLARKLGVTQNCVWGWFNRGRVSAEGAIAIEKLTKGRIAAHKLRPETRKAPDGKHDNGRGAHRRPRKKTRSS